jgi:hypothetical protein
MNKQSRWAGEAADPHLDAFASVRLREFSHPAGTLCRICPFDRDFAIRDRCPVGFFATDLSGDLIRAKAARRP